MINLIRNMFKNPNHYNKFFVALAAFVVSILTNYFSNETWIYPVITFIASLGVYQIPNSKE